MTFAEAAFMQPGWVQIWLVWLMVVLIAAPLILLLSPTTRRVAIWTIISHIPVFIAVPMMYQEMGYVRLLGLPHLIFWFPLLILLIRRIQTDGIRAPFRQVLWILAATLAICLLFDASDTIRYLLGERAPLA